MLSITTPLAPLSPNATGPADLPPASPGAVRVEAVEVGRLPAGRRVRAVVRLGALSPADVYVELVREGARARATAVRMWSCQAYGNGCFVFEAAIPGLPAADRPPVDGWAVRVRPVDEAAAPTRGRWPGAGPTTAGPTATPPG